FCCLLVATAHPDVYTLSLHDALPIWNAPVHPVADDRVRSAGERVRSARHACPSRTQGSLAFSGPHVRARLEPAAAHPAVGTSARSEEHTSELQSRENLVCRLLLEKKK